MSVSLLDVNVLIASIDVEHVAYRRVHSWLRQLGGKAWATCPLTQAGFVRVISNPAFHRNPVSIAEALQLLLAITERPGHHFWPMDISLAEAVQPLHARLFGHRQLSDAYLLGLAIKNKGRLVTLDRGTRELAGTSFVDCVLVL